MVNIPNGLTILRILCVPVFVNMIIYERFGYALVIFLIAALTDGLDGLIARMTNQRSRFGTYLDPLADKVLLVSAFVTLSVFQLVPIWLATIVVSRDLIVAFGTLLLHLLDVEIDITPSWLGKFTTVAQIGYVVIIVAIVSFSWPDEFLAPVALFVGLVTMVSGFLYIFRGVRAMRVESV